MGNKNIADGQRVRLALPCAMLNKEVGAKGTARKGFAGLLGVVFDGDDPDLFPIVVKGDIGRSVDVIDLCEVDETPSEIITVYEVKREPGEAPVFYAEDQMDQLLEEVRETLKCEAIAPGHVCIQVVIHHMDRTSYDAYPVAEA